MSVIGIYRQQPTPETLSVIDEKRFTLTRRAIGRTMMPLLGLA
jgi:hypothetical protein